MYGYGIIKEGGKYFISGNKLDAIVKVEVEAKDVTIKNYTVNIYDEADENIVDTKQVEYYSIDDKKAREIIDVAADIVYKSQDYIDSKKLDMENVIEYDSKEAFNLTVNTEKTIGDLDGYILKYPTKIVKLLPTGKVLVGDKKVIVEPLEIGEVIK